MRKYPLLTLLSLLIIAIFPSPYTAVEARSSLADPALNFDVLIDVGHGGIDGGTSHGTLSEKELNLAIGSKLYSMLREQGYKVGITRLNDYALSDDSSFHSIKSRHARDLRQRRLIAEEVQPKVFVSIHVNFSANRYVHGPLILYQESHAESYLLATFMQDALNQVAQTSHKSRAGSNFYLLKTIKQPAIITEVGYISSPQEREKLQDEGYQTQLAERMFQAIKHYLLLYA